MDAIPSVLLVHPGTQYGSRLAVQLQRLDYLGEFHTGFVFSDKSLLGRAFPLLPMRWKGKLANRRLSGVPAAKLQIYAWREIAALMALARSNNVEEVLFWRNKAFQRAIPDAALIRNDVVIGFDTSSWILAQRCQDLSKPFVLDQSIGHPAAKERMYTQLRRDFPDWGRNIPPKESSLLSNEKKEQILSNVIVCPSTFVAETLGQEGIPSAQIVVNPFGTDLTTFSPSDDPPPPAPFIFLFVGSVTARKGVPVLLQAWREVNLKNAELWIAGSGILPQGEITRGIPSSVRILGKRSRSEVAALMRLAHVFVFPSFFEGLAQVQVEALASGLPVVATRESGAADIVTHGINGWIIGAGNIAETAHALRTLRNDPSAVQKMREEAISRRDSLSWEAYGDRWAALLEKRI
jgi:glycosyltransferase involved in cell wall biosynthesis